MSTRLSPSLALPADREHGWHREGDCPVADLVRAYAELHRRTHGGTVAACQRQPCAQLIASLAPGKAAPSATPAANPGTRLTPFLTGIRCQEEARTDFPATEDRTLAHGRASH